MTHSHRVLVVDDHPDSAEIACVLLGMMGHECRTASSGAEALAAATTFDPEIAILDLGLPDLSGFELARELRVRFHDKKLFMVALTGWGDAHARQRTREAGFDRHVVKPADGKTLRALLQDAEISLAR